jgi:hypothetical protein
MTLAAATEEIFDREMLMTITYMRPKCSRINYRRFFFSVVITYGLTGPTRFV